MHSRFVELSVRASGYGCTRAVWRTALVFSACLNSEMVAHESFNSTVPRNYQDKCDMSHFPNPSKVRPSNTVQQGFTLWARRMDIRGWFTGRVEQTETKINTNCGYKHDKTTHVLKKTLINDNVSFASTYILRSEHFKALTKSGQSSAIADHTISTGHNIKWDHFEILATGRSDVH